MDYKKLTEDLIKARLAAEKAAEGEDGGSANLDTLTISLKRAREVKVVNAAMSADLIAAKIDWLGPRFFIYPPECGQGNSRVRAIEAMEKVMKEAGYDVLMYYRVD